MNEVTIAIRGTGLHGSGGHSDPLMNTFIMALGMAL